MACNAIDVDSIRIFVRDDRVTAAFDYTILEQCDTTLTVAVDNQSTHVMYSIWDYETDTTHAFEPGSFTWNTLGEHTITLYSYNDTACHPIDTVEQTFTLLPNAHAEFIAGDACENVIIPITNLSINPLAQFDWSFSNGFSSNDFEPQTSISTAGIYIIDLLVIDTLTCDTFATDTQAIEIHHNPIPYFQVDSSYYYYLDEVTFTNLSQYYDHIEWYFGDGDSLADVEQPVHIYPGVHTYEPCIVAYNTVGGCVDTFCLEIYIDFTALLGVPNAFSPNGDGNNDRLFVEGMGITNLNFEIYNRWGELVYKSNDQSEGWDGTYKGVPQEMEVYVFVVDAVFVDGTNKSLKGNVTLLR